MLAEIARFLPSPRWLTGLAPHVARRPAARHGGNARQKKRRVQSLSREGASAKAAERTVSGVRQAIQRIFAGITPTECANYFASAGYDPI